MTKAREWPNAMREHRDRAAEEAQASLQALRPLIDRPPADPAAIAGIARAVYHIQNNLRHLEAADAQTRPT
jgi:hypothetical protein